MAYNDINRISECVDVGDNHTHVVACLYVCVSHLQLCERNDVTGLWAVPDGLLGNSIVVVVLLGLCIQQLPPLVVVHWLTEGREGRGRRGGEGEEGRGGEGGEGEEGEEGRGGEERGRRGGRGGGGEGRGGKWRGGIGGEGRGEEWREGRGRAQEGGEG